MRRFFTLVCLLCLAIPAGISLSGCTRNPAAKYCNLDGINGYGLTVNQIASITMNPVTAGISLAYGQTQQTQQPQALTCKGDTVDIGSRQLTYGSTNNQIVDISPTGALCAGTWNRNTGGGIADYTYCTAPNPLPSTGGLPYGVVYITATAASVTSNPVAVYVHAPVTSITLASPDATTTFGLDQCFSQGQTAQLDAQACYSQNGKQILLCAPSSITSANSACTMPSITPDIIASGIFTAPAIGTGGSLTGTNYVSGGTISGSAGQTCKVSNFNNGGTGTTATITLSSSNTVASGTPLLITAGGTGATASPTQATLSSGTATCSGVISVSPVVGTAGQYCNVTNFNNGSQGATATLTLSGTNTITGGTPLIVLSGGMNATAPPTTATLSSGTATCSGSAAVVTTTTPVPTCESSIGTLNFSMSSGGSSSAIGSINATTNQITAEQPGTALITASLSSTGSSAGYFSVCPPASISLTLANGSTAGTVTQGVSQNLSSTVIDSKGHTISGLVLDYQSTNPMDISSSASGTINTSYPGVASITAICQPGTCNPAPISAMGTYGTGLSIASNPVNITTPGTASDFIWYGAPGQSQYFGSVELLTGVAGGLTKLPYVPNSMVMDQGGNNFYFGSARELMVGSTLSNAVGKQDTSVPGVVLAVAPNNSELLINDQARHVFYVYSNDTGILATFSGMGNAAAWTQDSKTLYITDNANLNTSAGCGVTQTVTGHSDTLYVYNTNTGWTTYPLPPSPLPLPNPFCAAPNTAQAVYSQTPAITVPSVGAYMRGTPTVAHAWCPIGTVDNTTGIPVSTISSFYPGPYPGPVTDQGGQIGQGGDEEPVQSDVLASTFDGKHILGAQLLGGGNIELSDIAVALPSTTTGGVSTPNACPSTVITNGAGVITSQTLKPLTINAVPSFNQVGLTNVSATAVNQVITGSLPAIGSQPQISNLAFITYNGSNTGAPLPYYLPSASGAGTLGYLPLTGGSTITAPVAGAFSPDNTLFFVSTAGDNKIHYISIPTSITTSTPLVDKQQISPNLPSCSAPPAGLDVGCVFNGTGTTVPATVITVKPRATT